MDDRDDGALISPAEIDAVDAVLVDCRFSLADPAAGERAYRAGHIPDAFYLHLERDLSGPVGQHGGRHPLPDPTVLAATLAGFGIGPETPVIAYDDNRFAFAARLWWLMRALGYRPPRLLNGGYAGWLQGSGAPQQSVPAARPVSAPAVGDYRGACDIDGLRALQAQGATLVDAREERRYLGLEEPIDPVAGHIPGAVNRPWVGVTDADGRALGRKALCAHWGDALGRPQLAVYCGSGVTACVNLWSLDQLGRGDAVLYAGSWSDWCSHL